MKRIGYLWEKITDINNIELAVRMALKNKKKTRAVIKVSEDIHGTALKVREMLLSGNFKPCKPHIKIINERGKERVIQIPKLYPDQIIHWAIMIPLTPVLERGMYSHCCGSVKGRGGKGVQREIKRVLKSKKYKYILKGDIRKFFNSIDINILKGQLRRVIKDNKCLDILGGILDSTAENGKGLPIGYYPSQILSNFYLLNFDHEIKDGMQVKKYIRYVDDIALFGTNKRKLHRVCLKIDGSLFAGFKLKLKGNWQVWRINTRPLAFVGYRYYEFKILICRRTFYIIMRTVRHIKRAAYVTAKQARGLLSRTSWLKHIYAKELYLDKIKPVVSFKELKQAA